MAARKSPPRSPQSAQRGGVDASVFPVFDRFKVDGKWQYKDQQEHCFVWQMEFACRIPMSSIDDFIEGLQCDPDGNRVQLPEDKRAELLEERSEALSAYRAGNRTRDEKWAAALHRSCRDAGMLLVAVPLAKVRRRQIKAHENNPGGRPSKNIDERALLAEVGKGITYNTLAGTFPCSPASISEIVKKHGGAAAVRRRYRRKQPGR